MTCIGIVTASTLGIVTASTRPVRIGHEPETVAARADSLAGERR